MTPTQAVETMKIQRTVFDLASFDDVKLVKEISKPTPVTSVEEALAAVGNDRDALLSVINEGLEQKARESAYSEISGFNQTDENGDSTGEQYTGKFVEGDAKKTINNGVLTIAKMFSGGAWDSATTDQKRGWKDQAKEMIRSNPAMLSSWQV